MQRVVDEAQYVLKVLHHMKLEVSANPELYDPDARARIEEAIARVDSALQQAQSVVSCGTQNLKAA